MQFRLKKQSFVGLLTLLLFTCVMWIFPVVAEAAVPASVKIPVSCSGGNPLEQFTFVMEMETHELQTPDGLIIRMKSGEEGAFTIHYVYPGTYHYRIRQEAGADQKTSYDSTVYEVDVYVTEDENGQLHTEPVVYTEGSSEKKVRVDFKNSAHSSPSKTIRSNNVQTGDSTETAIYTALLAASLAALLAVGKYLFRKKGGNSDEK